MPDSFDSHQEHEPIVLQLARKEAQGLSHKHIGTEHLLLGWMREQQGAAARVLSELGVTHDRVQNAVRFIIGEGEHAVADDITLTPRAKNVVELAIAEARTLGHDAIDTEHLLLALLREGEGVAVGVLESLGINLGRVWANTYRLLGIRPALRPELPSTHRWRDRNVRVLRERLNRRRVWSIQGYSQVVGPLVGLPQLLTSLAVHEPLGCDGANQLRHPEVQPAADGCAHENTGQHRVTPQQQALALATERFGKGEPYLRLDRTVKERQGNVQLAHGTVHAGGAFPDLEHVRRARVIQEPSELS